MWADVGHMFLEAAFKAFPTLHNKGAFNISPTANKITPGIITPGYQLYSDTQYQIAWRRGLSLCIIAKSWNIS